MNFAAVISLLGLATAIFVGFWRRVNIGLISIVFAFFIGVVLAGKTPADIVAGWPMRLFFMLLGMTLLFGIAAANGTLTLLARKCVVIVRGHNRLLPPVFFLLSGVLAALGPGNIAVCVLVLPIAMTVAAEHRIPPLLMATLVIAGANAGGLSPIAPTGIIGVTLAGAQGLDIGLQIFTRQIAGQSILAATLYFSLGGHRLPAGQAASEASAPALSPRQVITIGVLLMVVAAVVIGRWDLGLTAFTGVTVLLLLRTADENTAFGTVPWSTLVLVCGVGLLVNLSQEIGGIELLTRLLARWMNARTAAPIMALIGGVLSIVSSASGVVMPTLIPAAPGLAAEVGADAARIIAALIMGAHVVTNSPISTLGALAVASAGNTVDRARLFRDLFVLSLAGLGYAALLVFIGLA